MVGLDTFVQEIEDLYVKRGKGGHHSPVASKYIAKEIDKV